MTNPAVLAIYNKVVKMCNEQNIDVYLYVNKNDTDYYVFDNTCYFSYDYLKAKYNYDIVFDKDLPYQGLMNLPLIDLYTSHPEYDNYIFYEDDILYQGSKNLFTLFNYSSDIVFQSQRMLSLNWYWYVCHNNYSIEDKDTYIPYEGLLNIFSVSNTFLKYYYNFLKTSGLKAFHEYSINSYAYYMYTQGEITMDVLPPYLTKNISHLNDLVDYGKHYDLVHPIKDLNQLITFSKY